MAVDLARALDDWEYRESVVGLADPLVTFLRRVGAYAYDHHETIDFTDWNGAIVGRGAGPVSRKAIPLDPTLPFSEFELSYELKTALAWHAATPAHVLNQLAGDPNVRPALAWRRDLPSEAQLICAGASDPNVRMAVAKMGTDLRALTLLLKDAGTSVRAALAENPNWHGLEDLALDEMAPVRRTVAERVDAPRELLEMLAADSQSEVARSAATTLAALHHAATGGAKKG